jgi:hypothetical protein
LLLENSLMFVPVEPAYKDVLQDGDLISIIKATHRKVRLGGCLTSKHRSSSIDEGVTLRMP